VVVREVTAKTILNRTAISDYSLNCYTGCEHACVYCYARFMQRFHPHPEPWGEFVDVKVNAVEVLRRQLRRAPAGEVFVSSACDGWQPVEARYELTRRCCELLLERGFQVNVLTKSALVLRDLALLTQSSTPRVGPAGGRARVGVTVTTLKEGLRKLWEPRTSTVEERFEVLAHAHAAGLKTAVMFGPLLPFLSDGEKDIDGLFARAADLKVDVIWVDALNPRPRVWPSVAALLRRDPRGLSAYGPEFDPLRRRDLHGRRQQAKSDGGASGSLGRMQEGFPGRKVDLGFRRQQAKRSGASPELEGRYRAMLFDQEVRAQYLAHLRQRVHRAAARHRLTDRLRGCP
jgi:DNA repair photolyase